MHGTHGHQSTPVRSPGAPGRTTPRAAVAARTAGRAGLALLPAVAAFASVLAGAAPAAAGDSDRLELHPRTATPGSHVTAVTTACGRDGHGTGDANSMRGGGDFPMRRGERHGEHEGREGHDRREGHEGLTGRFQVPHGTREGTYRISVSCENGRWVESELRVAHHPTGPVHTGAGGAAGTDTAQLAAGIGVLGAAGFGALWLRRRAGAR
ncbi:hypothetical protein ACN20G_31795 (plasmid) [Streptomyces sp. BI20]|uniref:hypothetical protein n=1 Tax=Streptomyces sp. BI20 TaxID=3403460 RepID=UPI003C76D659